MPSDGGPISVLKLFDVADPASNASPDLGQLIELFNRQRNVDWSVPEAFLCLLLAAAMADGSMSVEEQTEIEALSRRSRALKSLGAVQLSAANAVVRQRLDSRPEGLREACEILPEDMRLPISTQCANIGGHASSDICALR